MGGERDRQVQMPLKCLKINLGAPFTWSLPTYPNHCFFLNIMSRGKAAKCPAVHWTFLDWPLLREFLLWGHTDICSLFIGSNDKPKHISILAHSGKQSIWASYRAWLRVAGRIVGDPEAGRVESSTKLRCWLPIVINMKTLPVNPP